MQCAVLFLTLNTDERRNNRPPLLGVTSERRFSAFATLDLQKVGESVGKRESETERERKRETERETKRVRDIETEREREIERETQRQRQR